ncbi:MAG: DUF5615 family PIN-like protein [Acidimicrobiales bacterium]
MKLLLDEMHAQSIAMVLSAESFDVVAVTSDPELRGMSDEDLLVHSAANGQAIVTENVGDFTKLVAQRASEGRSHCGLILTNPKRFNRATLAYPGNVVAALREFLDEPPVVGESWVWWL